MIHLAEERSLESWQWGTHLKIFDWSKKVTSSAIMENINALLRKKAAKGKKPKKPQFLKRGNRIIFFFRNSLHQLWMKTNQHPIKPRKYGWEILWVWGICCGESRGCPIVFLFSWKFCAFIVKCIAFSFSVHLLLAKFQSYGCKGGITKKQMQYLHPTFTAAISVIS